MQRTIITVREQTNHWDGTPTTGPLEFITVLLAPEYEGGEPEEASVGSKAENVDSHLRALKALIGKPSDFTLESKGEYNGVKQWKMKDYPGKPGSGGGGGGGGGGKGGGNWESPEERAVKNASIEAQGAASKATSLAVAFIAAHPDDATTYDEWVERIAGATASLAGAIRAAVTPYEVPKPTAPATAPTADSGQQGSEVGPSGDGATAGAVRNEAMQQFGGIKGLKAAYEEYFGATAPTVNDMTLDHLNELLEYARTGYEGAST